MCRLQATHHFYYNVYFRIIYDGLIIVYKHFLYRIPRKITKIQHVFDPDLISCTPVNTVLVGIDHLYYSAAYSAVS